MPRITLSVPLLFSLLCLLTNPLAAAEYEVLLQGGRVIDGTGAPWYYADVALRDGKIAKIGRIKPEEAERTVDCTGLFVAPGFIDMMGQTGTPFLTDPEAGINLLTQGITTINAGEGVSAAPLAGEAARAAGWSTMREYFAKLDAAGMPVNLVQTVGHTQVRRLVLGDVDRRPLPEELEKMRAHVREAMEAGAIGVSTALIYPPAVYADTEEIAALVAVAGESGGGYYTHMRNEGDRLLEAMDEALAIAEAGGTRLHIFHLKAAGQRNWGKYDQALAKIKAARAEGRQVGADIYPYLNNGLGIVAFIPPRHAAEGTNILLRKLDDPELRRTIRQEMETSTDFENWYLHIGADWDRVVLGNMSGRVYREQNGRSLAAVAANLQKDPWDVFFEVCQEDAFALPQTMTDANLCKAMREEFISFCTDVGPAGGSSIASHPRAWGAFPRILSRYVRDLGVISLEQAVSQMSAVAANELLLFDRGRIATGLAADIVVFDFKQVTDRSTLAEPQKPSEGVAHLFVNGVQVLEGGKSTRQKPGRVLRGPGYRP